MEKVRVVAAGDSAILILFKQEISEEVNRAISATVQLIKMQQIEGIVDMIPAYASLLVEYNPLVIRYEELYKIIETPTNFYLMLSPQHGSIVIKENCSDELLMFLDQLKTRMDKEYGKK